MLARPSSVIVADKNRWHPKEAEMATREQDVVNRMYEALNADDLARYYSDDCEVVAPPGELRGREAVQALAQTY